MQFSNLMPLGYCAISSSSPQLEQAGGNCQWGSFTSWPAHRSELWGKGGVATEVTGLFELAALPLRYRRPCGYDLNAGWRQPNLRLTLVVQNFLFPLFFSSPSFSAAHEPPGSRSLHISGAQSSHFKSPRCFLLSLSSLFLLFSHRTLPSVRAALGAKCSNTCFL